MQPQAPRRGEITSPGISDVLDSKLHRVSYSGLILVKARCRRPAIASCVNERVCDASSLDSPVFI